jgi:hypothetical protein
MVYIFDNHVGIVGKSVGISVGSVGKPIRFDAPRLTSKPFSLCGVNGAYFLIHKSNILRKVPYFGTFGKNKAPFLGAYIIMCHAVIRTVAE